MPLAIFDLDNTLIDRAAAFRRWADGFIAEYRLDPDELDWLHAADGDGFAPRREFFSAVRDHCGLTEPVDLLLDAYRAAIVRLTELDPAVPAALDRLHGAGWRVAIATNGHTAHQLAKIRATGLDAHADSIAVSDEVGAAKPDARMFEAAALRCGAGLAGGWMVGDCPTRDIAGGRGVGLRTIWVRRGRSWNEPAAAPDAVVDSVVDAAAIVLASAG